MNVLKSIAAVAGLALVLASCGPVAGPEGPAPVPAGAAPGSPPDRLAGEINAYRTARGLSVLAPDRALQVAATAHARDMAEYGYFSHTGRNGSSPSDRIRASGYRACATGENIAFGQRIPADVFEAWRTSPGHDRIMRGTVYREYGVGQAGDIWVLLVAAPCG